MTDHQSEKEVRIQKHNEYLSDIGNPYPSESNRTHTVDDVFSNFDKLDDQEVIVCGRIRFLRDHGKLSFAQLEDFSGKIQIALAKEDFGDKYKQLRIFDVGDIVEVTGKVFITKKGEQSILVSDITMLSKALQPLPDKWHGIQDEELRYRKRYVDMLMNPELRGMFVKKSIFWNAIRSFLLKEDFLEVETPVLEVTPGGADAEPFKTHHNALDIDLYLRISMGELWQKRLMVGGFEKTFEIGRQFRNEGMSPEHLQDYTQMEFYWAYANYRDSMKLVERMYKYAINEAFGTLSFSIKGNDVNLDQEWQEVDYTTIIKDQLEIDILDATDEEILSVCKKNKIDISADVGRGRLIDALMKNCRKSIVGPVFLVNHPVEVSPLAKRKADDPRLVERYQVLIAGSELGNGYTELNDPIDQRARFNEQAKLRDAGDAEAQMHDEDFVEALEVGMPPTSGFGVSERLFSFLMDKPIKECVMFPLMRPKHIINEETVQSSVVISNDITLQKFDAGISRADAKDYMFQEVTDENLRKHMLATEALMVKMAEHFSAQSPEAWGIAGLLHDIDYEDVELKEHSLVGAEMLKKKGVHDAVVDAVREHNQHHGIEAKTIMSKNLQCLEQLTGLIIASTLVRPDKKIASVEVKSIKKKFKDKSFAKGVERDMIKKCDEMLGINLDQAIELCLEAMQGIAEDLELA
ncbi:MAG: lysine--tRNA ligase [bacterium]|nr:lysine--tRNA ligase [bacterium]